MFNTLDFIGQDNLWFQTIDQSIKIFKHMLNKQLLAKKSIKYSKDLYKYQCSICFQLEPTARRCSGPCKAIICLKCATNICQGPNPICPRRCSSPINLQKIPNFDLEYLCPYGGEECQEKIVGLQQFVNHHCKYLSEELKEKMINNEKHLCDSNHPLLFLEEQVGEYIFGEFSFQSFNRECFDCRQKKMCRSVCVQCSKQGQIKTYCHDCRPLPCTKELCPIGHQLSPIQAKQNNLYCDLCGFCIYLYSNVCYMDYQCNFGFCGVCFQKMPDKHELVPLKSHINFSKQMNSDYKQEQKKQENGLQPEQTINEPDQSQENAQQQLVNELQDHLNLQVEGPQEQVGNHSEVEGHNLE